jgi:tRNA pseudouridine38-40 synthase
MTVIRILLAYDGTGFRGWARQRGVRTVEGELTVALSRVLREAPKLSVAGRTDAGVHARGQVASFSWDSPLDLARLQRSINGQLAPEVVALDVRALRDGFDARHSATGREYRYRLNAGALPDPFEARFEWHRPGSLDLWRMREAARELMGEHDFASFCRAPPDGGSTVRTVNRLAIARRADRFQIMVAANAFLHQMVRSLVGTLVAVGQGRIRPEATADILAARDRSAAGSVAPAHGLTLERVVYGRSHGGAPHRPA